MKVTLLSYTPDAAELLIFTKNTRLEMTPEGLSEIKAWPEARKHDELTYMARTNPGSWEFVDYVFMLQGVTRAFTHQLVRTRTASYAQQTMRVLKVSKEREPFPYETGPSITANEQLEFMYKEFMQQTDDVYNRLIDHGAEVEDARGVLPTNICTNICAKFNLRTLAEMVVKRSGVRTQNEYRQALDDMVLAVLAVHPWAEQFLVPRRSATINVLEHCAVWARQYNKDLSNTIQKEADLLKSQGGGK